MIKLAPWILENGAAAYAILNSDYEGQERIPGGGFGYGIEIEISTIARAIGPTPSGFAQWRDVLPGSWGGFPAGFIARAFGLFLQLAEKHPGTGRTLSSVGAGFSRQRALGSSAARNL